MLHHIRKKKKNMHVLSDDKGSTLLVCLLVLMTLTTIGLVAHQTSKTEIQIAVNEQRWEKDFNVTEGGSGVEASNVGYARDGAFEWFEISNPLDFNQFLVPPTSGDYDPGSDIIFSSKPFPSTFLDDLSESDKAIKEKYWPRQNLIKDDTDDRFDYAYLVTYLGASETGVKGYDAGTFAAYQFRINGDKQVSIERGGIKIGVKPM